jgi:hypothetical protein
MRPARIGVWAGGAALLVGLVLLLVSLGRESPGGAGENIQWLLSYLLLLGFPTSLLVGGLHPLGVSPVVVRVAMVLALAANWAVVAYVVAKLVQLLRRRPGGG